MGFPMAGHLVRAGHTVSVYNRNAARAKLWLDKHAGASAPTPAAAARDADLVMTCVGGDNDVRAVVHGPGGALSAMAPGAILVDHTTASASLARELAQAAAMRQVGFLDAPVSGGQSGAEAGKLAIMVGGAPEIFARAEPVLASYARAVTLMGGPGCGQLTKMVNQICVTGLLQALAEGVAFAQRSGLDVARVLEAIGGGAAQSWQMHNRSLTMAEDRFDFGFAVDWMRKDLAICLTEARANGAALPVTALVDQFLARLSAEGGGRADISSLIRLLRDRG